jgi:hypothetical protein
MDTALGNMSDNDFYSVEVPSTTLLHRTEPELVAVERMHHVPSIRVSTGWPGSAQSQAGGSS